MQYYYMFVLYGVIDKVLNVYCTVWFITLYRTRVDVWLMKYSTHVAARPSPLQCTGPNHKDTVSHPDTGRLSETL